MKRTWSQANDDEYGQLGIIESVKLRNFMCHDNLSFDFDPHMNFIVGRNGSGKSAVLTGIILALGGKSGATGRFSNIKGFVKTGKNSASVSVTLKNCGPEAYKPDEYGEKITIERHFTSEGVSSYKLKSEAGRIISNSKEELTNILNVMDIQIENPITVLTQETSRNFLVSKNSKGDKLFKLFYEGTGLSKVYDDYNRSLQQSKDTKSDIEMKKAILPDMEKDIKTLKALLDKSSKVNDLRKELFWAMVIDFEAKRDAAVKAHEKMQKDVSDLTNELKLCEDDIADICRSEAELETDKNASKQKMEDIRKNFQELNSKILALKSGIRETQGSYSSHEREAKKIESRISDLEKVMLQIKMKNQHDINEDKLRHETAVKDLQNQITDIISSIRELESKKNTHRENLEGIQKKIEVCQAEIQEVKYEKNRIMTDKQKLTDGMKNRLNVYGSEMINALREIKTGVEAGIFKQEPKGPIGLHINVNKPEWDFAVQECMKIPFLRSFVCDNYEDRDKLSKIFSKCFQRQRPSIITSKFVSEVYDVTPHKCIVNIPGMDGSQYPTLLDMLNVQDPVILNCLIDQKQIENILLIEDPVEARRMMLYHPPQKCIFAYSVNGDQFCHSPFRKYSCRNKNQFCLLKSFNEEDIKKIDEESKILTFSEAKKLAYKENLCQQLNGMMQDINRIDSEIVELKLKVKQLHMKLKDEENSYSEPKDINDLHTDLDELKREKTRLEDKLASIKEVLTSQTGELRILVAQLEECKKLLGDEDNNFRNLSQRIEGYQSRKEKLDFTVRKIKSQLEQMQPVLKDKEQAVERSIADLQAFTIRAVETCPRINTERSVDTIRHLLNQMEEFLKNKKNYDPESLIHEYEKKVENFNKARKELSDLENLNKRFLGIIARRFQDFQKICKNTSVSLTCAFTTLLKENDFVGYPDVNFESKTLEIFAKPEKTKLKFGNKPNLSQLSGGERSYVTIAFLLSLWDRIHTPFRILDEYDVFMDSNNRHLSIHLLVNTAKSNKKIQYIFLSPLELPPIEDSDHVKVHQMPAPRE